MPSLESSKEKMALQNGDLSKHILHSQAHIYNHIFNFINSMSLKCAIQLEIPDIIHRHGSPMTLSELLEALPINKEKSHCIYRLMRMLVHSGFFIKQSISKTRDVDEEEGEGYILSPVSRLLLKDDPLTMKPLLLFNFDPVLMDPFHHLSEWLQNDDLTPFETAYRRTFFDYVSHEPKINHLFNDGMASDARLSADVVMKNCRSVFKGLNSIVDVGGGTGTVAKTIADTFPDLRCISFDLPHVVAGFKGSKNLSYVGGDMFEAIPAADAIMLKCILHNWNDEQCIKILKLCKEAIPSKEKGGKVIIIDIVMNNQEEVYETQLFFDIVMMVGMMGKERNEKEWSKIFVEAGFKSYKITRNLGLRSLIEIYP